MVVRTRLRAILTPFILYCVAAGAVSYFVYQARYGVRGLETKVEYKTEIAAVKAEYDGLRAEHQLWQHRVDLMRSDSVDRDLLEEEAHALLSRFDRRDLVIFLDPRAGK
jgi:cell division protein FtsB